MTGPAEIGGRTPRRLPNGQLLFESADLSELTRGEVSGRHLAEPLAKAGYRIDPRVARRAGVNTVVRIESNDSTGVYAKTEENEAAKRAEVVASSLLFSLGWVGIADRVTQNLDGTLLLVPELGSGDVEDKGTVAELFAVFGHEDHATISCKNANFLRRLTQENLRLRLPQDALLLLLFDAAICNTDRHARNLKYGSERTAPPGTPRGRLLPVDHGRSMLNADPSSPGRGDVSPLDALNGESPYGLPNQLIRPAAEFVGRDFAIALAIATDWVIEIRRITAEMVHDWDDFAQNELGYIAANAEILLADLTGVLDQICSWVIA